MTSTKPAVLWSRIRLAAAAVAVVITVITCTWWWPRLNVWVETTTSSMRGQPESEPEAGAHEEAHAGHDAANSLELSDTALRNLGLTAEFLRPVAITTFRRTISIPAVVVERPGRTEVHVSAPLSGVVTHVHAVTGEAVEPGTLLFEIRLTHEELVTSQTEFLKSLGELEVEEAEVRRLKDTTATGAIAGKTLLERQYARDRLLASIRAQREALKLHGLSDRHIDDITRDRKLLRSLHVVAPDMDVHAHDEELRLNAQVAPSQIHPVDLTATSRTNPLIIDQLSVDKGQAVNAGDKLCVVSDFSKLFIEGQAFDQDSTAVSTALDNNWPVTAVFPGPDGDVRVDDLRIGFLGTEVDRASRSLSCFVDLPNTVSRDVTNADGQRFVSWKFRPGQRLQVLVPVEEWANEIVLPIDAVVREGADWFVFQQNGSHFDRKAVHVKYRDPTSAVIANDGSIFPGDVVALRCAHQMQMAIKNKSGAGADPHAGHNH